MHLYTIWAIFFSYTLDWIEVYNLGKVSFVAGNFICHLSLFHQAHMVISEYCTWVTFWRCVLVISRKNLETIYSVGIEDLHLEVFFSSTDLNFLVWGGMKVIGKKYNIFVFEILRLLWYLEMYMPYISMCFASIIIWIIFCSISFKLYFTPNFHNEDSLPKLGI